MKSSSGNTNRSIALVLALGISLTQTSHAMRLPHGFAAAAQAAAQQPPPPAQIASAHSIFLANSGSDPNFPIESTEAFNAVYANLQSWGHYQLVSSPAQADLVFQLHGVAPITNVSGVDGSVISSTSPAFQLTILDPKTNVALWTVAQPVNLAGNKQTRARWAAIAEKDLVSRVKVLAGQSLSPAEIADLNAHPNYHQGRNAAIFIGLSLGLALAGSLILYHEYKKGLANQKAQQDAFCQAHGIPLSMCAGG